MSDANATPDPDSPQQIERQLPRSARGSDVARLIEHLGARLPTVDLRPDAAGTEPVTTSPKPADAGHFPGLHLLGEIARGGMGVILRGQETDLRRDVAIKVLQQRFAKHPEVLARFVEEAQIGGQLQHPGIVPVYQLGVLADERPYFTMKLVKGETLAARLLQRREGPEERRRLLDIFLSICHTMAYAHSRRVVHRDLKPANVMVGAFGEVQVVDWGLAKVMARGGVADERRASAVGQATVSLIQTLRTEPGSAGASVAGSVIGTPSYMPPEQARGAVDELDERSDVFSLGAILCELLTGQPPYGTEFRTALIKAATADLAEARQRLAACGADAALVQLCERCLAPAPTARPRDAGELVVALQQYLAAVEQRVHDAQLAAVAATTRAEAARKTRNLTVALAATALLALGVGGGGYLWVRSQAEVRLQAGLERVRAALEEAALLRGQQRWTEAAASARVAVDLLPAEAPTAFAASVREELAQSEARVRSEREASERAVATSRLLAELRAIAEPDGGRYAPTDWTRVDARFAAICVAHGLQPDAAEPVALASLQGRGVDEELAQSLIEWAAVRRKKGDQEGSARLFRLAMRLDPDPDRVALRSAVLGGNADAVVALAKSPQLLEASAATLVEVVRSLRAVGRSQAELDLQAKACLRHPDDALLAFEVAAAFSAGKQPEQAVRLLHGAMALRPDALPVRRTLASLYELELQDPVKAETFVRESLRRQPGDAYLHQRLASSLLAQERYDPLGIPLTRQPSTPRRDEAVANLRMALQFGAHPDYHQVLANTLAGLGRFEESVAEAQAGLALAQRIPCDAETQSALYHTLGGALNRLSRFEESVAALRQAVAFGPESPHAVCGLAKALAVTDRAAGLATVEAFLARHPDVALAHDTHSGLLVTARRWPEAIAAAERAIAADPGDARYWVAAVSSAAAAGEAGKALQLSEAGLARHPGQWELLDQQCELMLTAGRAKELQQRLADLLARDPRNASALGALGRLASAADDHPAAMRHYRQAVEAGLATSAAYTNLADATARVEGPRAALPIRDRAIELWPALASLYYWRARDHLALGQLPQALADADQAARLAPQRRFGRQLAVTLLASNGRFRAALADLGAAIAPPSGAPIEVEPPPANAADFLYQLGTEWIQARPGFAAEVLRQATEQRADEADVWCNYGHALAASGRHAEALAAMERGHALGTKRRDWQYPSEEWLARCRFFAQAEANWLALVETGQTPQSFEEQLGMAQWAIARGEAKVGAALAETLLAGGEAAAAAEIGLHLDLARALLQLAAGAAGDERLTQLGKARQAMVAHLSTMRGVAQRDAESRAPVAAHLRPLLVDEDFEVVRGAAELAGLPAELAASWRQCWRDLQVAIDELGR